MPTSYTYNLTDLQTAQLESTTNRAYQLIENVKQFSDEARRHGYESSADLLAIQADYLRESLYDYRATFITGHHQRAAAHLLSIETGFARAREDYDGQPFNQRKN